MNKPPRKPDWLKVRLPSGPNFVRIDRYHRQQGLHSVCRSAACPNQGECWNNGTATFMILGDHCTRGCRFCNVQGGQPLPLDPDEPARVATAIAELQLRHAVITSVTRDDLDDGGAAQFAELTAAIRKHSPDCIIELLIPDLGGDPAALQTILDAAPDILGHNIETVPRLYPLVRAEADYRRSLQLLQDSARSAPQIPTKSGLMLGLGETVAEVKQVMRDLLATGCRLLTLGQYLQPTRDHQPVTRYLPPEEFDSFRDFGLELGFRHVEAGPLVRSSYHAAEQFQEADHGNQ
ncbi:lipoyl synthase [Geothermobacter hydrogeniphilus]|uniref:Lipoyl synthase n=1 Tax=Geothermobacter hydrogeniphilus TaxID=1969733 RepID=A0A1X0Y4W7_9BACT|nr:lipoyl synthase [Geothermobacter hydrogeniphilus]ORJ60241.1 lipoyl synthase [Geothermobacter hydrogeniphilus]